MTEQEVKTTSRAARKTATRKKRVPISGNRDILTISGKEPGYVYRWVNDVDNRIQKYLDAGYIFVDTAGKTIGESTIENARDTETGSVISKYVGKGITSYLMAQKEEWYEEDQRNKAERTDRSEGSLKSSGDGSYGKLEIKRGGELSRL
jgi:hypothetical protein